MCIRSFLIRYTCALVGSDKGGNRYYLSKRRDHLGRQRRMVVYSGDVVEPGSIPPDWHAWIHYLSNNIPN
jgi:NADH:ubiquinone oxidoreductase subunit